MRRAAVSGVALAALAASALLACAAGCDTRASERSKAQPSAESTVAREAASLPDAGAKALASLLDAGQAALDVAPSPPCAPALSTRASEAVDAWRKKHGVPGVAVAIVSGGASCIATSGARGQGRAPVTPDTAFSMGSMEQVFDAALLAYVIEQGKARLDDPAARHVQDDKGKTIPPEAPFAKATLRNLVTHTASLASDDSDDAEADLRGLGKDTAFVDARSGANLYRDEPMPASLLARLVALRPAYPFGTRYAYSNEGFAVAGYAAASIAKTPYSALLREVVVEPLGLARTGVGLCDEPKDFCASGHLPGGKPAGKTPVGLWTTAGDLTKFLKANLGAMPLPEVQTRAFRRAHVSSFDRGAGRAVAMGWEIRSRGPTELHAKNGAGVGFSSWVGLEPQVGSGVAVLANVQQRGEASPAALGRELLEALRSAAPRP